jgi:hypothetical protein
MALPARRHQDATQVWVTVEADAEHVPDLALVPVGRRPEVRYGWQGWRIGDQRNLDANIGVSLIREEVIHDGEVARRLLRRPRADPLVDRGEIVEHSIWLLDALFQVAKHPRRFVALDPHRRDGVVGRLQDRLDVKRGAQVVDERRLRLHPRTYTLLGGRRFVRSWRSCRLTSRCEGMRGRSTP